FETRVRQDTDEIYTRLDDEQSGRQLLAGRINMLFRDRRAHVRTARLMETKVRISREAWGRSMDASDLTRAEVMLLRTTEAEATHRGTEADKETSDSDGRKMAPKRTTRANPAATTATTSVTNAQLKEMIDQGVTDALAAHDPDRNTNDDDSHNSGTGVKRT
ncbi:hypothetical protein Tco_1137779, partial [Tanacetum coccineum]